MKAVFPGKYIQGAGAIAELPALVELFGQKGMIIASRSAKERILPTSGIDLARSHILVESFGGECCETELTRLSALVLKENVEVLIGMGGGKVIDSAKIVADRAGIPVIIIPTIASTDAPCSGCAVLYTEDGIFERVYYQKSNPAVVLVDVNIIAAAPTRFLVSGMGDALATWFEARSCVRTQSMNECGGYCTAVGLEIARFCYDTLLQYGVPARIASEQHTVTPALERIVEANILLSGIGFESAGLAAAHAIHNGLTALPECHAFYHGEKVAFGTLAGLVLTGAETKEIDTVFTFCEDVGLPTTLDEIGLKNVPPEQLLPAAEKACAADSSIHHEAGIMTPIKVLHALQAADAMGKRRKTGKTSLS